MERINATTGSYNFIDLFAGAGGLSEGFIQAGFSPVAHVEMNPYAAQTLETRTGYYYLKAQGKLDIYKDYISGKITRDEFLQHIPAEQLQSVFCETMSNETLPRLFENIDRILTQRGIKQVDVIIGGPPCQAYSLVGRAQSKHMETPMSADPRNDLYKLYARFLQKYQPKMFVFENVMGIKSANGGVTCPECHRQAYPSRFITICENGHMDDFPWSWWVHGGNTICKGTMRMYSTGNTSTLADMWVKCSCGARRSMSGATQHENFEGMKCSGHHPFRPNHKNEKCDKEMIPSQRGASNVYFPVMRSAISIPPWINPLYNLIDEHLRLIDNYEEDFGEVGLDKAYQKYFSAFTREEFDAALLRRRQNIKEFTEIKQMEYNAITHHADPVYASNKKHFKAEEDPLPDYLLPYFKRVIRITRLREVRVLLGFTRVDAPDPDADEQTNIVYLNKGKTEKWLPAAEVHGEGVFIEFNRDSIDAWLRDPELGALSQKYAQCYKEFCESKEWTVTTLRDARYVLMHTFAHLLIKQMSMSSGYSSSAIRERIYFGDDMSGVLLYTGSADKEGSLGGLVELGNIDQLIVLMKDAFQEALVCTNDPECLNNVPAGNNSNGAACHSCCMISETACENGNRMLDRGLIVPIDGRENQSYFKTLVEELCQLEV